MLQFSYEICFEELICFVLNGLDSVLPKFFIFYLIGRAVGLTFNEWVITEGEMLVISVDDHEKMQKFCFMNCSNFSLLPWPMNDTTLVV